MIYRTALSSFLITCSLCGSGPANPTPIAPQHIDPRNAYVQILAVVPLIGAGTQADPIRPAYTPAPQPRGSKLSQPDPTGILGFTFVMSDDNKHALVEFVARDRSAFQTNHGR